MENRKNFEDFCNEVNTLIDSRIQNEKHNSKLFIENYLYHFVLGIFIGKNKGKIIFFVLLNITVAIQILLGVGMLPLVLTIGILVSIIINLSLLRWIEFIIFFHEYHEKERLKDFFIEYNDGELTTDYLRLNDITQHHNRIIYGKYEKLYLEKGKDAILLSEFTSLILNIKLYEVHNKNLEEVSISLEKAIKPSFLKDSIFFIQALFR